MTVKLFSNFFGILGVITNKYKWYVLAKYYFLIKMVWVNRQNNPN